MIGIVIPIPGTDYGLIRENPVAVAVPSAKVCTVSSAVLVTARRYA